MLVNGGTTLLQTISLKGKELSAQHVNQDVFHKLIQQDYDTAAHGSKRSLEIFSNPNEQRLIPTWRFPSSHQLGISTCVPIAIWSKPPALSDQARLSDHLEQTP